MKTKPIIKKTTRQLLVIEIQKRLEKTQHIPKRQIDSILCCFDKAWEDALKHKDQLEVGSFFSISTVPHPSQEDEYILHTEISDSLKESLQRIVKINES